MSRTPLLLALLRPADASTYGGQLDSLFLLFGAVCAGVALAVHAGAIWALLKRGKRGKPTVPAGDPPRPEQAPARALTLSAWGLCIGVVVVGLFIASERTWAMLREARANAVAGAEPTRVLVIGERFTWNVVLPGPDGVFGSYLRYPRPTDELWSNPDVVNEATSREPPGFTFFGARGPATVPPDVRAEAIELYVEQVNPLGRVFEDPAGWDDDAARARALGRPIELEAGRPVEVLLGSRDVIHSFFVPAMRVKLDAVPGLWGRVRFVPQRPGEYELICAEFCGWGHYTMTGLIIVHPAGAGDGGGTGGER